MPDLKVPWGEETLTLPVPPHWNVQHVAEPDHRPAPADWPDRLAGALNQPLAGPPLGRLLEQLGKGRLTLVVEDLTRYSPLPRILPVLMKEIRHAGIANEQIELLFATGMHPPLTPDEARDKLGPAVEGLAWRCNPWDDEKQYTDLGRAAGNVGVMVDRRLVESDLRILVASVSPHLQAGFGGGYKMYFPGCGLIRNIRLLHRVGIRWRGQRQLVGTSTEHNPMRAAIDAAGQRVDQAHGKTFSVQYLLDGNNELTHIATGEVLPAHRMLTKQCAVSSGVLQPRPVDILITNAHPRDHDLWQCFKCIPNTCWAARPNGVVVCLARCPAGLNDMKQMAWPLSPAWTRRMVRFLGPETIASLMDRLVKRLAGDSLWFIRLASQILQRNWLVMVSPQLVEDGVEFPGISIFADPAEALAYAESLLDTDAPSTAVYPWGGASYPVMGT